MQVTIIGCGNAGTTIGADLAIKGHQVTLMKSSGSTLHNAHYAYIREHQEVTFIDGNQTNTVGVRVTEDMETAMRGAELIIVFIQTNYQEDLIKRMAPYIEDGQTFIVEPGYLSTCFFLRYTKKDITIIEAESSPIDCRIMEPGVVKTFFKNTCNPFGVYPASHRDKAKKVLDATKYPYVLTDSVVEAALHNPNLIVHTTGAMFSIPRIEYVKKNGGPFSMYKEVFQPHIWNLIEALDKEKMDVLEALGLTRLPYVEACKMRNATDDRPAIEVFFDYAYNGAPDGPYEPDSRYITEDVPEGLVMLESLGNVLDVPTPICSAIIDCTSALLKMEFRKMGRTVNTLGRENLKLIIDDSKNA